jgi:hypothetical protein
LQRDRAYHIHGRSGDDAGWRAAGGCAVRGAQTLLLFFACSMQQRCLFALDVVFDTVRCSGVSSAVLPTASLSRFRDPQQLRLLLVCLGARLAAACTGDAGGAGARARFACDLLRRIVSLVERAAAREHHNSPITARSVAVCMGLPLRSWSCCLSHCGSCRACVA